MPPDLALSCFDQPSRRATGQHTVTYDDGDVRRYEMHGKEYQLLALPPARRCVRVFDFLSTDLHLLKLTIRMPAPTQAPATAAGGPAQVQRGGGGAGGRGERAQEPVGAALHFLDLRTAATGYVLTFCSPCPGLWPSPTRSPTHLLPRPSVPPVRRELPPRPQHQRLWRPRRLPDDAGPAVCLLRGPRGGAQKE